MSFKLALPILLFTAAAVAASDDDPLPAGTKIRILTIEPHVTDLSGGSRALTSSGRELSDAGISTRENTRDIVIDLSADVLFDFDRADLRPSAEASLLQLAQFMSQHVNRDVRIEGYTDAKGGDVYNQKLSLARAEAVHRWLTRRPDFSAFAFTVAGRGASNPLAPNVTADGRDDPAGRQKNRRVEILIRK